MRKYNLNILAVFCVLTMTLAVGVPAGAVTRYVPSPYPMIQGAIDASAMTGDEIEVAPGTYDEAINFNGKAIRLYSSDGPEVTTIDMSILPPDSAVVTCNSGEGPGTILEGFTITSGNSYKGGGMYNDGSSPTVTNCIFIYNTADYGGGMYNGYGSNPNVTDCIFQGNTASVWGAGMFNNRSSPTVTNCEFLDNDAGWDGGGMFNELSSPTVIDCNFIDNTATQSGGGMYSKNDSNSIVNNCTFSGNEALGTASEMGGGGMYNLDNSNPTVTNCTITNNSAHDGAGMYNTSSSPTMINCNFSQNTAGANGGGMYNGDFSPTIVTNCILWGDTPNEIANYTSNPTITYCDVQGGWGDPNDPNNTNINADPRFVDAYNPDPNLWNLRLLYDSPCIDAGDSTSLLAVPVLHDLDGKFRYWDIPSIANTGTGLSTFLDMGAYEFQCSGIAGDVNCDGAVDFKDLAIICNNWLTGTEPEY